MRDSLVQSVAQSFRRVWLTPTLRPWDCPGAKAHVKASLRSVALRGLDPRHALPLPCAIIGASPEQEQKSQSLGFRSRAFWRRRGDTRKLVFCRRSNASSRGDENDAQCSVDTKPMVFGRLAPNPFVNEHEVGTSGQREGDGLTLTGIKVRESGRNLRRGSNPDPVRSCGNELSDWFWRSFGCSSRRTASGMRTRPNRLWRRS